MVNLNLYKLILFFITFLYVNTSLSSTIVSHKAYYDFHNADTVSSWYVNDLSSAIAPLPQWETVAEGIDSFSISLKSSAGNAIAKGAQSTQPIGEVIIDCSIFEPSKKFASQAEKHKTIRDFNFFFTLHSYVDEGLNPGT